MTDTIHIDRSRALALAREVVAEYGENFRYRWPGEKTQCVYAYDGAPSCLVGHVLHRAGVTVDELHDMAGAIGEADDNLPGRVHLDDDANRLLRLMQGHQDGRIPWGQAVTYAVHDIDAEDI